MPSVRPRTSWAPSADLSQTPACIRAFLSASRLVSATISAIASSTTLRVLENGALKTVTPRSVAACTSIWLVPMQNAPIASSSGAASRTRCVTWVLERMPSRVTLPIRSISSSSSSARASVSTSKSAVRSIATASGWICSSRSTRTELSATRRPHMRLRVPFESKERPPHGIRHVADSAGDRSEHRAAPAAPARSRAGADPPVDEQRDDGPDDRTDQPSRLQGAAGGVLVEQGVAEESADERPHDAEHDRAADTDRVPTRNEQSGERSGNQTDDDEPDDESEHAGASLAGTGVPTSAVPAIAGSQTARRLRTAAADPDAAGRRRPVSGLLAAEVERPDPDAAVQRGRVERGGRHDPGELELDAVRILAVERLRGAVVGRADQGTGLGQLGGQLLQVVERVDLPGEVVQADGAPHRRGRLIADLEQSEVVVVGRPGRPEECGARYAAHVVDHPEAEHVTVEGDAARHVSHVEHGVVEAVDGHHVPPGYSCPWKRRLSSQLFPRLTIHVSS